MATRSQFIQKKMASLGEMTAGIAHKMRNPLNFQLLGDQRGIGRGVAAGIRVNNNGIGMPEAMQQDLSDLLHHQTNRKG